MFHTLQRADIRSFLGLPISDSVIAVAAQHPGGAPSAGGAMSQRRSDFALASFHVIPRACLLPCHPSGAGCAPDALGPAGAQLTAGRGRRMGTVSRELHGTCSARCDRDSPDVTHTWAARRTVGGVDS